MTPKVTIPHLDTIWITSQTGETSDFFERTVSMTFAEWQELKRHVDNALTQSRVKAATL